MNTVNNDFPLSSPTIKEKHSLLIETPELKYNFTLK